MGAFSACPVAVISLKVQTDEHEHFTALDLLNDARLLAHKLRNLHWEIFAYVLSALSIVCKSQLRLQTAASNDCPAYLAGHFPAIPDL